jgi:hypothetical protein
MPLSSVSNWFRLESRCTEISSYGWKNLQKEKYLLDHCLCWKVGNETAIQEGTNHLMGLGARSVLTPGLLSTLNSRGINFLSQLKNTQSASPPNNYWKNSTDLALIGDSAMEWELF